MSKSKSSKPRHGSPDTQARKREEKARRERRRRRHRVLWIAAILAVVAAAGGWGLYAYNQGEERIRDLTAVGLGVPAVVQVHDATCPVCSELRANVESIEGDYSDDELLIRIADVHTDKGAAFASRHTMARRATLLFLNGEGELVDVRSGAIPSEDLKLLFSRHISGEL
ncbi:MAG: hypothetical protein GVY23_03560 [Spirochaetes bacterium]|jgi:hypothetical protein|nr:hypothetical protein [Spirochaetota bacterium]